MRKLFRRFSYLVIRIHKYSLKKPVLTLVLSALFLGAIGWHAPKVRALLNFNDYLDENFPAMQYYRKFRRDFSFGNSIFVIFRPRATERFSHDDVCKIHGFARKQSLINDELVRITTPVALRMPERDGQKLWYMPIVKLDCLAHGSNNTELISFSDLTDSPWGLVLTDKEGKDLAIEFMFRDTPGGSRVGSFDPAPVGQLERDLERAFGQEGSNIDFIISGTAAFQFYSLIGLRKDRLMNLAVIIIILLLFRVFFGTWRGGFMLVGTLIFMGIVLYGTMGLFNQPIDMLSNGLFLLVSVSAIQDFLFISHKRLHDQKSTWRTIFKRFVTPSFFTSITTVFGFGSLYISELEPIRRFGLFAAYGAMLEWCCVFLVLPSIISIWPRLSRWTNKSKTVKLDFWNRLAQKKLPGGFVYICIALVPLSLAAAPYLKLTDSPKLLFLEDHVYIDSLNYIHKSRGWEGYLYLVFEDSGNRELNQKIIQRFGKNPHVEFVQDPYAMLDTILKGFEGTWRAMVKREVKLSRQYERIFWPNGGALAVIYLKDTHLDYVRELHKIENEVCKEAKCHLVGELKSYFEFSEQVVPTLLKSFILSLTLVSLTLILIFLCHRRRTILPVIFSALWGALMMVGVCVAFDMRVNFLTCVCACVLVGISGDNAIQYLYGSRNRGFVLGAQTRGGGSIKIALSMILATSAFLASEFQPPRTLAVLLCIGLSLNLFGDLWFLKGILKISEKFKSRLKIHQ